MRLVGAIGVVVGLSLSGPLALAADNGSFSLKSKEAQLIVIGTTARELRICNNVASGSPIGITLGSRGPLVLRPGNCVDDMGDRILATNQGSATAMGTWRTYYAPDDRHQQMQTVDPPSFGLQRGVDFFFERNLGHDGVAGNDSSHGEGGNR